MSNNHYELIISKPIYRFFPNTSIIRKDFDKCKYYVYQYIDPRNEQTFYVGKGKDKRFQKHLKQKKESTKNLMKYNKIHKIIDLGLKIKILLHPVFDEDRAYDYQATLIKTYGMMKDGTGILTNMILDSRLNRKYQSDKNKAIYEKQSRTQKANWRDPNSTYNQKWYRQKMFNHQGENNPKFGDHRSWQQMYGLQKSNKLKKEMSLRLSNGLNPKAKTYKIIDPNGEEYICHGVLRKKCLQLGINYRTLKSKIGSKIEDNNFRKNKNTIGWTVYEIDSNRKEKGVKITRS